MSTFIGAEKVDELRALDDPSDLERVGHWLTWLLLHGYGLSGADVPAGYNRSNLSSIIQALVKMGCAVDRVPVAKGEPGWTKHRAVDRVFVTSTRHGTAIPRKAKQVLPPVPAVIVERAGEPRTRAKVKPEPGKPRSVAVEVHAGEKVVRPKVLGIPPERLALLRVPPTAPGVGTTLRVGMVAETNGHATIALHDEHGTVWFATVDQEGVT